MRSRIRVRTADGQGHFHAELKIGDAPFMVGHGYFADPSMAAATWVYVPDVDATYKRALKEGARSVREACRSDLGDRVAGVKDSSGKHVVDRKLIKAPEKSTRRKEGEPKWPQSEIDSRRTARDHAISDLPQRGRSHRVYKKAFGAKETIRMAEPNGRIGHAELVNQRLADYAFG